jgi:hypothetical protein
MKNIKLLTVLLLLSITIFSCKKSEEITTILKSPSSLKQNTMEVKYLGNNYTLDYYPNVSVINYGSFKSVRCYSQGIIPTNPKNSMIIDFDFPLPIPTNKKYKYAKTPSEYYKEGITLVSFFLQDQITYDFTSIKSGALTTADGNLEITDFQEGKYIQGKFYFNLKNNSGLTAEAEGMFNISF